MNIELDPKWKDNKEVKHLAKLVEIAMGDTGQCSYVRNFLLHLYNWNNPVDLVAILCGCDIDITESAFIVMKLRHNQNLEPHHYFVNGTEIFELLLKIKRGE